MKLKYITLFALFGFVANILAQQTPAPEQSEAVTIVGATAHLGNGEIIENSLIIFEDGKITQVMNAGETKIHYRGEIIQAEGKHVYPGFIAANATLGLVEVDAVRATDDEDEIGEMLPHIRSIIAYNAESKLVESMRPNGVLMGQIVPRGSRISGTSSVVQFDAWNWEDAVLKENDAIHINWPSSFSMGRWWAGEDPGVKANEDYRKNVREITDFFNASKAYLNGEQETAHLPYQAMESVFDGTKSVFIHVDGEKEILDVIQFSKDQKLDKITIVGGYDALKVADELIKNNISVLTDRPHNTPDNEDHDYDFPYKLAAELHQRGVLTGIQPAGRMERMNTRNLPFYAGTAVAHGLEKEEALKLITSNVAQILGIEDFAGTLEKGKDATLFISEGDALDMRGNVIERAFIQGRDISLETHQTQLYKRYSNKYKEEKAE